MQLRATINRLEGENQHSDQDSDDIDKAFNYVPDGNEQRQYVSEFTDNNRLAETGTQKMIESTMDHGSSLRQTTTTDDYEQSLDKLDRRRHKRQIQSTTATK